MKEFKVFDKSTKSMQDTNSAEYKERLAILQGRKKTRLSSSRSEAIKQSVMKVLQKAVQK